jgi:hypothetical protein
MKKLFALIMLIFSAAPACAADNTPHPLNKTTANANAQKILNFYSAVCISNETGRAIKIRGGFNGGKIQGSLNGGGFDSVNLSPGKTNTFVHHYYFPNENRAPRFIFIISNIDGSNTVVYHTNGAASPDTSCEMAKIIYVLESHDNLYAEGEDLLGGGGP